MRKKSQATGGAAAALIGIITLILIFFIILIPPEERAKLLGEDLDTENGEPSILTENILLDAAIGRMTFVPDTIVPHLIPNIVLQEIKQAQVLEEINPFIISKGVASEDYKTITFGLENPEYTDNVLLSFKTPVHEGVLKIILNNFELFEADIITETPMPIKIRKDYLQKMNTLQFQVLGFGFPKKQFSFENIKILGEITDPYRLNAFETIPLRSFEYNSLDTASLDFYPICNQFEMGNLEIKINNNKIFSGVPSCDSANRQDISKQDLIEGKNTFEFGIKKGTIRLEQMRLKTYLKPNKSYTSFFKIDDELIQEVGTGEKKITLEIKFTDEKTKKAKVNINGEYEMMEQKDASFIRDISDMAIRGNNFIELTPLSDLNVLKLQIRVE